MSPLFREGDQALVTDARERRYMFRLASGKVFESHLGKIPHDRIIGQEDGSRVLTHLGSEVLVLRPTYHNYIVEMPRTAQIIYPKDIGAVLVYGDIYPGATVVEAGLGSGAMTLGLLRAVGPTGRVTSYEVRDELVARSVKNIQGLLPETPNLTVKNKDIYLELAETGVDRIVLDVPEPWRAVAPAAKALRSGGIMVCYLPTVLQVHQLNEALENEPCFDLIDSFELLLRPWYFAPTSARPVHRMVAHTGFITTAVRCAPKPPRLVRPEGSGGVPDDLPEK